MIPDMRALGMRVGGFSVLVSPDLPKIQISKDCPLPDDFRAEMNAWCLSFFGTTNVVADTEFILIKGNNTILVNPRTFDVLKKRVPFGTEMHQRVVTYQ